LKAIEDVIRRNVVDSKEEIHILRPKSSSLFKTYDGIEIIGQRMLKEIFDEIKRLADEDITITKISIIGYSLGGIVSRYIIGELEKINIFDHIEPQYFATFATPHVGTWFFKKRFKVLNILGSNLIGLVGAQLFIKDEEKIFVKLSEGDYINGLKKFKKRFLFANIRHDRTVNFATSFITDKNPFDAHWEHLKLSFDFDGDQELPLYKIRGVEVKPKIVNFADSTFRSARDKRPNLPLYKKVRYAGILLLAALILPIWIPFVFTASTIGSIVSYVIVKTYRRPQAPKLKEVLSISLDDSDSDDDKGVGFKERLDEAAEEAFENAANIGQYDPQTESPLHRESAKDDVYDSEQEEHLLQTVKSFYKGVDGTFKNPNVHDSELFHETEALPLDEDRLKILKNLSELDWIKFAVYVNVLNAHDGIVARKGLKKSTVKGIATISLLSHLLNEDIKDSYKKS
jgi:hypothetical protein